MQENNGKEENASWEWLATEVIHGQTAKSKAKDIGIICVTILAAFVIAGLLIVNHTQTKSMENNNRSWIEYLSQYDFVSQDGEGYNYYNSDIGGDVNNGAEDTQEEVQE